MIDPRVEDGNVVAAVPAGDLVLHPIDRLHAVVAVAPIHRVEAGVAGHHVVGVAVHLVVPPAAAQPVPAAVAVHGVGTALAAHQVGAPARVDVVAAAAAVHGVAAVRAAAQTSVAVNRARD